jgi:hypothetical protein
MDEDVRAMFEEIEGRLSASDKRFDDMKWYFGGVATLFTVGFSVLTLVLSWNFSNEKTSLREFEKEIKGDFLNERASIREFEKDIKVELGKIDRPPDIQLFGIDGLLLAGEEMRAEFKADENGDMYLILRHILRNAGEGLSGPLYVKVYASDPVVFQNRSADESRFKYEHAFVPEDLHPSQIPGQFSAQWFHEVYLPQKKRPPQGKYDMLLKVFYGKGQVSQAQFRLVVE